MAKTEQKTDQPVARKLASVPFVVDGFIHDAQPRIWKSKPSKANPNPTRVGVNLGSVVMRIAGSAATFAVPIGIAFETPNADPAPRVNMPTDDSYVPQPLFKLDTTEAAADLDRFVSDAATKFYAWYAEKHSELIPLKTVDHKWLSERIGKTDTAASITVR